VPFVHPANNALQYPLLFPTGEEGWRIGIQLIGATRSEILVMVVMVVMAKISKEKFQRLR
jgi:hypothetical protein